MGGGPCAVAGAGVGASAMTVLGFGAAGWDDGGGRGDRVQGGGYRRLEFGGNKLHRNKQQSLSLY